MIHEPLSQGALGALRLPSASIAGVSGSAGGTGGTGGAGSVPRTSGVPAPPGARRDLLDEFEAGQLANDFDAATPEEVLEWAMARWQQRLAICTSFQAEGMALFDMAWRIDPAVRLFTVDTGRLPQETYEIIEQVRERYGAAVEVHVPEARKLERMSKI